MLTIIGFITILFPLTLAFLFKNRTFGFLTIFTAIVSLQTALSLVLMLVGILNYGIFLTLNIIVDIIVLYLLFKNLNILNKSKIKIDPALIVVIVLTTIFSYNAHFNYTGEVASSVGDLQVVNEKIIYPYFSDEWNVVAMVDDVIEGGETVFSDPYIKDRYFFNIFFPFFSFLSGLFLIIKVSIITNYAWLPIIFTSLLAYLVYKLLRLNNIDRSIALISTLLLSFIANSGTLPSLWMFLAYNLGLVFLVVSFVFMTYKNTKMVLWSSILSTLFYPPIIVFSGISLIAYVYSNHKKERNKLLFKYFIVFLLISVVSVVLIAISTPSSTVESFTRFSKMLFRPTGLPADTNQYLPLWHLIPYFALPFSAIGLYVIFREKDWLLAPTIMAIFLWLIYWDYNFVFIIGAPRVAVILAVLLIIVSAFGFQKTFGFIKSKIKIKDPARLDSMIIILVTVIAISLIPNYTLNHPWQIFVYYQDDLGVDGERKEIQPASPVTEYLVQDDLRVFKDINEKVFISDPWKSLVIASTTNNYPLHTKAGTMTASFIDFGDFASADCEGKKVYADKYKIDYAYIRKLDCPEIFESVDISEQGYNLYKYNKK